MIFILFILLVSLHYISGSKILDGTIYPSKNGIYYQEVEKGEQHVFKDHYGHKDNEKHFTFTKQDILPLKKVPFYHGEILVPNKAEKILTEHYGKDVFKVMYKKEDRDMIKIDISNCDPPPAEVV